MIMQVTEDYGGDARPGYLEGALSFRLDRRGAAKTVGGQYNLEFGDPNDGYEPPQLKLRIGEKPTPFQEQVAKFLGGYLDKERDLSFGHPQDHSNGKASNMSRNVEASICLPGVPQQETSHDCGFFIMEMILRTLSLPPKALRELATASSVEIAMLPWPSQQQILRRKAMLRDAVDALFAAARRIGTGDVEEMLKVEPELRRQLRAALTDGGPSFLHGFDRWAAGDWDLSPSVSRSRSRKSKVAAKRASGARSSSGGGSNHKRRRKKGRRSDSSGSRDRRRRRRSPSRSSTRSRSRRRSSSSGSDNSDKTRKSCKSGKSGKQIEKEKEKGPPAQLPSFSKEDLELLPAGALRKLCIQRNVLPAGIVERSDLLVALIPFAVQPIPKVPPPAPKAPAANKGFTRSELETMPTKELRTLCVQKGVLPPPPLERSDLVQALARFAAPG